MNEPRDDEDLELRRSLSALPRSVLPQRDLWSAIASEIERDAQLAGSAEHARPGNTAPVGPVARRRASWAWAMAASFIGVAIGVALTLSIIHRQPSASQPVTAATRAAGYAFVPASTDAVRIKMQRDAYAQLAKLPPATRTHVERDLNAITNALADIQTALAQDPGNSLLKDLLVSTYQDELSTLANVEALAGTAHTEVSL
jgi:hypothetical protein